MALLPDYLVCLGAAQLQSGKSERLMEILSAGLPVKVLTLTDDLLEEAAIGGDAHLGFGLRGKQLANMAIGLNEVFVLQASASHLCMVCEGRGGGFVHSMTSEKDCAYTRLSFTADDKAGPTGCAALHSSSFAGGEHETRARLSLSFMGALYSHVIIGVGSTVLWPQK